MPSSWKELAQHLAGWTARRPMLKAFRNRGGTPMIQSSFLAKALVLPPLSGPAALILSTAALAVPTAILSLDHALPAGACCTTFFPFVLAAAVLLGPVYASLVALGSAGLADAL